MTRQEIEAKISTIRNNNALPEKQKGMLLDKYERMLVDATIGDSDAGKIAPAKEKKAPAPRKPRTPKEPKVTAPKTPAMGEPDCDDLFEQDRERKAKAAIAAEKRRNAPKKTEATKNKEAVEKASAKVEKSVEKRIKSGDVSVAEIKKIIDEYETALKKLRQLLTRAEGKMKFGGPVKDQDISKLADKARDISNHHCGCDDKHEDGGSMYAGGGDSEGKNVFIAIYKGKEIQVRANSAYEAQTKAAKQFNAKKSYDVSVYVVEVDGKPVAHSASFAGGGNIEDKLLKELHKLQSDLGSARLSHYREGDTSEEEMARKRERESKLVRFNEVLALLHELEDKKSTGGSMYAPGGNSESDNAPFKVLSPSRITESYLGQLGTSKVAYVQPDYDRVVYLQLTNGKVTGVNFMQGGQDYLEDSNYEWNAPSSVVTEIFKVVSQHKTDYTNYTNKPLIRRIDLAIQMYIDTFISPRDYGDDMYSGGGNTERDAVEFFTDGGIGIKYIVNGKFDSARFKNDMITRTSKPNAESTIKHWGREMGINVSKYIDGDIIENTDFAEDSTKRAKQLFMALNKKMSTGGSMPKGWKHKSKK